MAATCSEGVRFLDPRHGIFIEATESHGAILLGREPAALAEPGHPELRLWSVGF